MLRRGREQAVWSVASFVEESTYSAVLLCGAGATCSWCLYAGLGW